MKRTLFASWQSIAAGWRSLAFAALPLAALSGCAAQHNHTGQAASCEVYPGCYETPMCFGYYSTCWRPWPEECPSCPPFTLPPPGEQVLPPPMTVQPMQPVEPMPPMPMPEQPESPRPGVNLPPQSQPFPPPPAPPAPPGSQGADYEPTMGPDGILRRRWVEGGFVSQPYEVQPASLTTEARPENR